MSPLRNTPTLICRAGSVLMYLIYDRCWNYSTSVGSFPEDPTICDRCNAALKGEF